MPSKPKTDSFTPFDSVLATASTDQNPWEDGRYVPDRELLDQLTTVPVRSGHAEKSGRLAKALDAWVAHELRRAGFRPDSVSPRTRKPRAMPSELAELEAQIDELVELVQGADPGAIPSQLRKKILQLPAVLPGSADANVLGRFYFKQVDVLVSSWQRGPDVLVSTKTMLSSYAKNKNNRYEEAVGEATNFRDRYPMASMGYVYLVRSTVYEAGGAYAFICDLLMRLRKPDGAFDATMLLVADWSNASRTMHSVEDPEYDLSCSRFFEDLLGAVLDNSPVEEHKALRRKRDGEPPGGLPATTGSPL